jgi:hypothetical protein
MKKKYMKPEVMFESFTLSTNIAGDCGWTSNVVPSDQKAGCGYRDPADRFGNVIFSSFCDTTDDDGDHNGICYDVPAEGMQIFNS